MRVVRCHNAIQYFDRIAQPYKKIFERPASQTIQRLGPQDRCFWLESETGALLGWHFGRIDAREGTYWMTNSATLPDHRRRGAYLYLAQSVLRELRDEGVSRFKSRHRPQNAAILAAKYRLGFRCAGTVEDPRWGTMIELVLD